jgi:DNA-binding MarR family transcriptional regulator
MPRANSKNDSLPLDAPFRRRLPILLRRAWYGLNQAFRRRIAHTSVTPDQFTVMRTLIEGDARGMPQSELTRGMASDPNTVASLLERMEVAGLIERQPHERDARAYRIRLTPAGKVKYDQVRELALQLQEEILSSLLPEKREIFLADLAIVADVCAEAAGKSPRRRGERSKSA